MFLLTSVLSGPDKLFLEIAVIVIVGSCLHWLFTEAPECPGFATMDFVAMPGSWDCPNTLTTLNQKTENRNSDEGRLNGSCHLSSEFSEISSNVYETCLEDTSAKKVISVTQEPEGCASAQSQSKVVDDSEFGTAREVSEEVINVETDNGTSHERKATKTNKNVGSKVQKTVDASAILASLILEDSAPKKAQSDIKMQAKKRRKNNAKEMGKKKGKKSAKAKAKNTGKYLIEDTWPEIEASDSFEDPEPESFAPKNPFSLLSGLGDEEYWKRPSIPQLPCENCEEVLAEASETAEVSTINDCSTFAPCFGEKTASLSQIALPILALNCNEIFLPAPSPSPDALDESKSPETPKSPRSPETPSSPWTPHTIDDDGFDYSQLIEKRKCNKSPAREYTRTLKQMPVLLPLRDTVEEWRKASSPPRCPSPVRSETVANDSEWQVAGGKRKNMQTWAQVASMSTPAPNPLFVKKTVSKEIKPNIVVLYKRKHTSPV